MGVLNNLKRRIFGDGGNIPQGGTFSPLAYGAIKPIVQEAYNVKDYVKEAKESEQNQLKAFAEMKVAQSMSADQEKSKLLHNSYTDAFTQASEEISNPFTLSKFAQKQAIDYVNNPLRRNIEESSKNLETITKTAANTPDVDGLATNGNINLELAKFEANNGTNTNVNSIFRGGTIIKNEDISHIVQSAEALANNMIKTPFSYLSKPTQEYLTGMGITSQGWTSNNFDKVGVIANFVLSNDNGYKNALYSRTFQNEFESLKRNNPNLTDAEARKIALTTYESKGTKILGESMNKLASSLKKQDNAFEKQPFALPKSTNESTKTTGYNFTVADTIDSNNTAEYNNKKSLETIDLILQDIKPENKKNLPSSLKGIHESVLNLVDNDNLTPETLKNILPNFIQKGINYIIDNAGEIGIASGGTAKKQTENRDALNEGEEALTMYLKSLNKQLPKNRQINIKNIEDPNNPERIKSALVNINTLSGVNKDIVLTNVAKDVLPKLDIQLQSAHLKDDNGKEISAPGTRNWNTKVKIENGKLLGGVDIIKDGVITSSWLKLPDSFQVDNNSNLLSVEQLKNHIKKNGLTGKFNGKDINTLAGYDDRGYLQVISGYDPSSGIPLYVSFEEAQKNAYSVDLYQKMGNQGSLSSYVKTVTMEDGSINYIAK